MSHPPAMAGTDADVAVRNARPGDLPAILAIEDASFSADRISRRSFVRLLGRRSASVLVAEFDRAVSGCAVVLFRSFTRRARLYSIAVAPLAKGRGIGSLLLAAVEDIAARRNCLGMGLEVRADNRAAIGFYERRGYRLIGRTEGYYSDGGAALHYLKTLAGAGQEAAGA